MENLQRIMEAIARTKSRPSNPHGAFAELLEVIGEHADMALLQWDDVVQHEQEYIILENELLNLKRDIRLRERVAS